MKIKYKNNKNKWYNKRDFFKQPKILGHNNMEYGRIDRVKSLYGTFIVQEEDKYIWINLSFLSQVGTKKQRQGLL